MDIARQVVDSIKMTNVSYTYSDHFFNSLSLISGSERRYSFTVYDSTKLTQNGTGYWIQASERVQFIGFYSGAIYVSTNVSLFKPCVEYLLCSSIYGISPPRFRLSEYGFKICESITIGSYPYVTFDEETIRGVIPSSRNTREYIERDNILRKTRLVDDLVFAESICGECLFFDADLSRSNSGFVFCHSLRDTYNEVLLLQNLCKAFKGLNAFDDQFGVMIHLNDPYYCPPFDGRPDVPSPYL